MGHFSEEVWVDFIRESGNVEPGNELKSHLDRGCSECAAALSLWTRVHSMTATEKTYDPPPNVLRMLKLEFASRYSTGQEKGHVADLTFDSLTQPMLAGVRSGTVSARQLVYQTDAVTVDLRLEKGIQSRIICAVGQILDKHAPQSSKARSSVILWTSRGLPVLETTPNEHGEFEFEFEHQERMRLSIETDGRNPVRITLPELI